MRILITNDDGIKSNGIIGLAKKLSQKHEVTVVAPDVENSGKSHSYSFGALNYKKEVIDDSFEAYALNGTPCDCVRFGITHIMATKRPDMVISGINNDHNVGSTIIYSGTVNAALEGGECNVKSIAVSMGNRTEDTEYAVEFVDKNLELLLSLIPSPRTILSINIPAVKKEDIKGVRFTPVGNTYYTDRYRYEKEGIYGEGYYVYGEMVIEESKETNTDCELIQQNYVSISPLRIDFTDRDTLKKIQDTDVPL